MRFASLGSGSRGNATLVEAGDTLVMIDCGFSCREVERRMAALGVHPEALGAIFLTHEHGDHVRGSTALANRYRIPVFATAGTAAGCRETPSRLTRFHAHDAFVVEDLRVHPFPVPHDAREPCQFVFEHRGRRLGLLTDTGTLTAHMVNSLERCDALLLECNHDADMLAGGSYPPSLKARVGGRLGHLSNAQAAALLGCLDAARLQHVVAAHLSERNNTPERARAALEPVLDGSDAQLTLADQDAGFGWREVV